MPINAHSLGHFAIRVSDVERAKKFYGETLGFELIRETQRYGHILARRGGKTDGKPKETLAAIPFGLTDVVDREARWGRGRGRTVR